ncbi:hypothetical protein PMAC_001575 [Pneumocystis sp. 'macacae']|nr:hypothetical protein PMAC_001575 [Pneumocystis sp. 'macacae']
MPVLRKAKSLKGFSQEKEPDSHSSTSSALSSSGLSPSKHGYQTDILSINDEIPQTSNIRAKIGRQRALSTSSVLSKSSFKNSLFGKEAGVSKNKISTIPSTINFLTDTFAPLLPSIIGTASPKFTSLLPTLSESSVYKNYFSKSSKKDASSSILPDHINLKSHSTNANFYSFGHTLTSVSNMFHPLQKSLSSFDIKHIGSKDNYANNVVDDVWPLLCMKILPLFNGEGLLMSVESLNNLVKFHVKKRYTEKKMRLLVDELEKLIEVGIKCFDANLLPLSDEKMILRLVELWTFFFSTVLPYIEAIFLPLQIEFEDLEWAIYNYGNNIRENEIDLNIRRITLIGFRDNIIIPLYERLKVIFLKIPLNLDLDQTLTDTASKLLQSILILASVHSLDEKQKKMDNLTKILCHNWFKSERVGRNRQGFIAMKSEPEFTINI